MGKTIKQIRLCSFIAFVLEILIFAAIGVIWYFDFGGVRGVPNIEVYFFSVLAILLIADIVAFWFVLAYIHRLRLKNDLDSAVLVGSEVQKAIDFGEVGLVVVDSNDVIMWTSSLFTSRQQYLVDTPVFEWQPNLRELVNAPVNKVIKLEIMTRLYSVKYVSKSRLFIFRDITEKEQKAAELDAQRIVLGIIALDNYTDIASDTDESAEYVNAVRNCIVNYFKERGFVLRRVKADTYFAVGQHSSLEKMEADKFSVLSDVRNEGKDEAKPITLSMGFATNFNESMTKLNEYAATALDVCLSRGGDQAVVNEFGSDLRFFGGKSAAIESISKVKVRSIADSILSLIKSSSGVYVMGHQDLDMDALGSCLGIKAICEHFVEGDKEKPCKIVYQRNLVEAKTKMAMTTAFSKDEFERMTITPDEAYNSIRSGTLLIVVDVSVPEMTMAPKLLEKAKKIIVIDHHRRGEKFIDSPVLAYVEPSAASASELIAEMVRYATANPPITIKPSYATIMLSGIFLDSNFFKAKSTGKRTFEACEILKENGADNSVANDYLKDDYAEYTLINSIAATIETPKTGVCYCYSDDSKLIERATLSKVANALMQVKGIQACFVIGKTDDKTIRISARSDGTINVQLLCERMGGGGHFTMAAASFKGATVERVINTLKVTLDDYLELATAANSKKGE